MLVAELSLGPGGLIAWIVVGLLSGWLAGQVMSGGGYGALRDVALGLVGSLLGGFIASFFFEGDAGFWATVCIAFLGSCVLIGVARIFAAPSAKA